MKNLLSLSKQKKEAKQPKGLPVDTGNINKWASNKQRFVEPQQLDQRLVEEGEDDYEPSHQQILEYAEFIGIDPIRQKNLLHLARQGLVTPVPPPWEAMEAGDEIVYINRQTNQKIWEHPCDQLFRQLVKEERRKFAKPVTNISSQGVMVAPLKPQAHVGVMQDPLMKLQQERKKKKLQQQRRAKFGQRKRQLQQKYRKEEQQVRQEYRQKQERLREAFRTQEEELRQKNRARATDQEKEDHQRINRDLQEFKSVLRKQLEATLQQRLKVQKESLSLTHNNKKEQLRKNLESEYKKKKKQVQQECNNAISQFQTKEAELKRQAVEFQKSFDKEILVAKEQIVERSLLDHKDQIEEHRLKEQLRYNQQVAKLEEDHRKRLNNLSTTPSSTNSEAFSLQGFIKQLQQGQESKLKILKYEMDAFKSLRKVEVENQLLQFEASLEQEHKQNIQRLKQESRQRTQREIKKMEREMELKISHLEKTANNDYLKSLEHFQKLYAKEEDAVVSHNRSAKLVKKEEFSEDDNTLKRLEEQVEELSKDHLNLKRQLERMRLEYETARQQLQSEQAQKGPVTRLLNEDQRRIYDRIMDMNLRLVNNQRQLQLRQLM